MNGETEIPRRNARRQLVYFLYRQKWKKPITAPEQKENRTILLTDTFSFSRIENKDEK